MPIEKGKEAQCIYVFKIHYRNLFVLLNEAHVLRCAASPESPLTKSGTNDDI